jgi:hypothetical protein
MDIITMEGQALADLLADLTYDLEHEHVHTVRVARDGDTVKYKVNEGVWSPPYPIADEDARRLTG